MAGVSKLTQAQWAALFAREAAGERRAALALEFGVAASTISHRAARMGLRKFESGAPDHRGKPPGGWPDDHVFAQSRAGMTAGRWRELLGRWLEGEPAAALAAEYGVAVGAIHHRAAAEGMRKMDRPGSVRQAPRRREGEGRMGAGRIAPSVGFADTSPASGGGHARSVGTAAASPAGGGGIVLRTSQRTPPGDWATWLFLGGRGAGKTLAGASWLADQAAALPDGRLALVGPTLHDVREVMIEGPSGVRGLDRWGRGNRPVFEPSRRRLVFPNGCVAHAFSAEDPESLRGPQFSGAWADEFCAWPSAGARGAAETLALLRMGLRLPGPHGAGPRLVVTTTPRPTRALIGLKGEASCASTHAPTADNAAHLSAGFLEGLRALYGGTRREAQELEGRIVELDGALFTAEMMARARAAEAPSPASLERIVVAIDPTASVGGDACGIVAAGARRRADGVREAVVLADRSAAGLSPDGWARRAAALAEEVGAVCMVAEVNQGGDMVRAVLRAAGCAVRVREVRATRGKRVRAEPVAALYEQGRVRHARRFDALEEELMAFGGEMEGAGSLDRADALVWAITDLLIDQPDGDQGPRLRRL